MDIAGMLTPGGILFSILIIALLALIALYLFRLVRRFGIVIGAICIVLGILVTRMGPGVLQRVGGLVGRAISPVIGFSGEAIAGYGASVDLILGIIIILFGFYVMWRAVKW